MQHRADIGPRRVTAFAIGTSSSTKLHKALSTQKGPPYLQPTGGVSGVRRFEQMFGLPKSEEKAVDLCRVVSGLDKFWGGVPNPPPGETSYNTERIVLRPGTHTIHLARCAHIPPHWAVTSPMSHTRDYSVLKGRRGDVDIDDKRVSRSEHLQLAIPTYPTLPPGGPSR